MSQTEQMGKDLEQSREDFLKRKKETEDEIRNILKTRKKLIEDKRELTVAIFSGDTLTTYKYVLGENNTLVTLETVEISGLNESEDINAAINKMSASNFKRQNFSNKAIETLSELEQQEINSRINKEIDTIFASFINGNVDYQEDILKDLIRTYKALEQELERLNSRIELLNNQGESK